MKPQVGKKYYYKLGRRVWKGRCLVLTTKGAIFKWGWTDQAHIESEDILAEVL